MRCSRYRISFSQCEEPRKTLAETCMSLCFHWDCDRCLTVNSPTPFFQSWGFNPNLAHIFMLFFPHFSGTFFCFFIMPIQAYLYWAICKDNILQRSESCFKCHVFTWVSKHACIIVWTQRKHCFLQSLALEKFTPVNQSNYGAVKFICIR